MVPTVASKHLQWQTCGGPHSIAVLETRSSRTMPSLGPHECNTMHQDTLGVGGPHRKTNDKNNHRRHSQALLHTTRPPHPLTKRIRTCDSPARGPSVPSALLARRERLSCNDCSSTTATTRCRPCARCHSLASTACRAGYYCWADTANKVSSERQNRQALRPAHRQHTARPPRGANRLPTWLLLRV